MCGSQPGKNRSAKQWQRKISKVPLLHEVVWQACSVCLLCNLVAANLFFMQTRCTKSFFSPLFYWKNKMTSTFEKYVYNDILPHKWYNWLKKVNLFCIRDPVKVAAMLRSLDHTNTLSICWINSLFHSNHQSFKLCF